MSFSTSLRNKSRYISMFFGNNEVKESPNSIATENTNIVTDSMTVTCVVQASWLRESYIGSNDRILRIIVSK